MAIKKFGDCMIRFDYFVVWIRLQLCLDNSGLYVATSCTDKTLAVYDYYSGECMATMYGHSELVTGLRFTNDGKHLISVSGDGCVFVWKLPHDMTVTVQARMTQQTARAAKESRRVTYSTNQPGGGSGGGPLSPELKTDNEEFGSPPPDLFDPNANSHSNVEDDYRFSVGQLPLWAKKQIGETNAAKPASVSSGKGGVDLPKGRWAQRMDTNASGITVKSFYQGDSVIPFPPSQGNNNFVLCPTCATLQPSLFIKSI